MNNTNNGDGIMNNIKHTQSKVEQLIFTENEYDVVEVFRKEEYRRALQLLDDYRTHPSSEEKSDADRRINTAAEKIEAEIERLDE